MAALNKLARLGPLPWPLRLVWLAVGIASACSADHGENQACEDNLAATAALAASLPDWPAPVAPGLEGPALRATDDADRFLVDPDPSVRGEHRGFVLERDRACDVRLDPVAALPLGRAPGGPSVSDFGSGDVDVRRAGLLVTGPDPSAPADVARWRSISDALEVRTHHLAEPSGVAVEQAVASTCAALPEDGLFLLVMIGAGTPTDGGGLVLSMLDAPTETPEAISYHRVATLIAVHCAHLALTIWVVDGSYFALEPADDLPLGAPLLVVRASDRGAPAAARATRDGPGLLGEAVGDLLAVGRKALCADGPLELAEIAALFADLGDDAAGGGLRAELLRRRWSAFGLPARQRLAASGILTPALEERLRARLLDDVPAHPILFDGPLPESERCAEDTDCAGCELAREGRGAAALELGACERAACVEGLCRIAPDDESDCDDGNDCTRDDTCRDGGCRGAPIVCDDGNACTDEACEPGRGCVAVPVIGRTCDDHDACTTGDACSAAGACVGAALVCDDGDPCTVDSCGGDDAAHPGCVFEPRSLPCDDGDPCTLADRCQNQVCIGTRMTCSDGNECTADRCDPVIGACRYDAVAELAGCDDGDPCTTLDRCRDGVCRGLTATCDDALACTFDRCDAGVCRHLPAPGLCLGPSGASCVAVGESPPDAPCLVCAATDQLAPTREGGACADDGIACTIDVCAAGACTHRDDSDMCHAPDGRCVARGALVTGCLVCEGGGVVRGLPPATPCDDSLACDAGRCDELGRCVCQPQ